MKYEAIIFDVSDTLIEYSPNYAEIFGSRVRDLGYEVSDATAKELASVVNWAIGEQTRKEQYGNPHITEEELLCILDHSVLSFITKGSDMNKIHLAELSKVPMPKQEMIIMSGVIEVLTILKEKYRLAIVSNHYTWLQEYLEKCGLARYFETIIISETVGVAKPNIRIMEIVLNELGLDAKNCLYVGDQPLDVLCSKQAGMDCAWVTSEEQLPETIPYKEDYRVEKISDLLKIL